MLFFFLSILILVFSLINIQSDKGYLLFVEFSDAYGLREGTIVNFRGVKVGYISGIKVYANRVIVLIKIQTLNIIIPKNCIIEANQIGLFNDRIVTITSLKNNVLYQTKKCSELSHFCDLKLSLCPNSYVKGYKGINYDDLIRATTRISQRFDDPRFFSLFYLLLKNTVEISDELLLFIYKSSTFFSSFFMLFL